MLEQAYQRLTDTNNKMFVAVAGNIGCGKTTLTKKLADRLGWRPMFESVDDNPYLNDFYTDMDKYSFPLQVYFLTHRFKAHREIESSMASSIQDRTIYEDAHIFARSLYEQGKMTKRDFENYKSLYSTMVEYLSPPTIMIFLKRTTEKLMERIRQRGRGCEQEIPVDYIEKLNQYYHEWYDSYNAGKCLIVDTDDYDFLYNEAHFDRLVAKIHTSIDQQDMFMMLQ